ncbi:MAG: saccharopine dehydrogenase NADP-binding domain-containing protein [Kiloniellales bacterium]|nr:saccharopine dehydrogenase NADP-binding domain-containing protein [Kiloniellales bacterium]
MRLLILGGAGLMGAGTVRDLLSERSSGVDRVVVADGYVDRLEALAAEVDDPRLYTAGLDLDDAASLGLLLHDADVCINAVATFAGYQMEIFEACLAAGTPYVDYGGMGVYTVRQKAEHERWREAGIPAVLGLGADPGLSNVICRAVADKLETIEAINLYWAATSVGPESPVLVPPYAASTVLSEYANPSQQFLDGKLTEVPPQSGQEVRDLPEPWGRTRFMHTQHSEPLTVPFAEGIAEKGIREMTWKLHLPDAEHAAWVGLVKAGFGDFDEPVRLRDGREVKPIDVLQAVIDRNLARNADRIPPQESHEIHLAIGRGTVGGKPSEARCRVMSHPHPLYDGYLDAGTSMCMSIGVQLLMAGEPKPGVWAPEEYFEPEAFFDELRRRHFVVEQEQGPPDTT